MAAIYASDNTAAVWQRFLARCASINAAREIEDAPEAGIRANELTIFRSIVLGSPENEKAYENGIVYDAYLAKKHQQRTIEDLETVRKLFEDVFELGKEEGQRMNINNGQLGGSGGGGMYGGTSYNGGPDYGGMGDGMNSAVAGDTNEGDVNGWMSGGTNEMGGWSNGPNYQSWMAPVSEPQGIDPSNIQFQNQQQKADLPYLNLSNGPLNLSRARHGQIVSPAIKPSLITKPTKQYNAHRGIQKYRPTKYTMATLPQSSVVVSWPAKPSKGAVQKFYVLVCPVGTCNRYFDTPPGLFMHMMQSGTDHEALFGGQSNKNWTKAVELGGIEVLGAEAEEVEKHNRVAIKILSMKRA